MYICIYIYYIYIYIYLYILYIYIIPYIYLYLGFLLRIFTNHRTAGEERGHFFNSSLPLLPASQTLRH